MIRSQRDMLIILDKLNNDSRTYPELIPAVWALSWAMGLAATVQLVDKLAECIDT